MLLHRVYQEYINNCSLVNVLLVVLMIMTFFGLLLNDAEHGEPGVTESSFASQKEVSIDTLKRNIESMNELNVCYFLYIYTSDNHILVTSSLKLVPWFRQINGLGKSLKKFLKAFLPTLILET